jgi:lysophospholipase L1-like esterase
MRVIRSIISIVLLSFITNGAHSQDYLWINPPVKIVVLGSSTAAGFGVSSKDSSWVNLYATYLRKLNPDNSVVNLAVGGYNTYHIMPDAFVPPRKRRRRDSLANITRALALDCDGIIVNLPSNDVALGYSMKEQLDNLKVVVREAENDSVPIWICTVQPRNFNRHDQRREQDELYDSIVKLFPNSVIDFWTGFVTPAAGLIEVYDSGDGCHLNDLGHRILNERVIESTAFDSILACSSEKVEIVRPTLQYPQIRRIQFSGEVSFEDNFTYQPSTLEIIQFDSVIASIPITQGRYSITTDIYTYSKFSLRFSSEDHLKKNVDFDLFRFYFRNIKGIDKTTVIDSIDITMTALSTLKETPADNNFIAAKCGVRANQGQLELLYNEDFERVQIERLKYYQNPVAKGKVKRYNEYGKLLVKLKYKNGNLHGKCIWYHETTKHIKVKARFENGGYEGKYYEYSEDGKVIYYNKFITSIKQDIILR